MRVLIPFFLAAILLAGFAMADKVPLLNAYELVRASGATFLPPSGTHFIADQAKLGRGALPAAWILWIVASVVLAQLTARLWAVFR